MNNLPPETGRPAEQAPRVENPLWARLRESVERLQAAGQRTTDRDALAQKLTARAKLLRPRLTATDSGQAPLVFLAFNKGRERYGVSVDHVLEVLTLDQFTVVPKTPPFLPGIIHWRGAILALVDLGALFGIPETGLADVHVCVVVEAGGRRVGLVAREIEDVFSVSPGLLRSAPSKPGNTPPEWNVGVYDNQCLILNLEPILQDPRLVEWRKTF